MVMSKNENIEKHLHRPLVYITQKKTQYITTCGRKEEQHVTGVLKDTFLPLSALLCFLISSFNNNHQRDL